MLRRSLVTTPKSFSRSLVRTTWCWRVLGYTRGRCKRQCAIGRAARSRIHAQGTAQGGHDSAEFSASIHRNAFHAHLFSSEVAPWRATCLARSGHVACSNGCAGAEGRQGIADAEAETISSMITGSLHIKTRHSGVGAPTTVTHYGTRRTSD